MEDAMVRPDASTDAARPATPDAVSEANGPTAPRKPRARKPKDVPALSIVNPLDSQPGIDVGVEPARVVEALLFSSDVALSAARLVELVGAGTPSQVRDWIDLLNEQYERVGFSFRVVEIARGFQLMTRPEYQPWLAKLNKHNQETRLSDATMETLAVVAYKQPIIRADIESIRGVACGDVLNRLREMGLVKVAGRAEVVGRPLLYGTTKRFLDVFGLADLSELPPMEALKLRTPQVVHDSDAADPAQPRSAAGA